MRALTPLTTAFGFAPSARQTAADLDDFVVAGIGGVEELLVEIRQALVRRARLAAVILCEKVHLRLVGRRPL